MPTLDVSDVLLCPEFADMFDVIRRNQVIDPSTGVGTTTDVTTPDVIGVVTQDDKAELMRNADAQLVPRRIFVATQFRLRGASTDYQPDQLRWNGTVYTIVKVLPYTRYGAGFVEVIAESMNATDAPTT